MDQRSGLTQLWLLLSLLAAGAASLYMSRVLWPWERLNDAKSGIATTTIGDLYPRWAGTRALLLDGKNPYGTEVSHEIQTAFYGHAIVQKYDEPGPRIDEQRFAYPVYVVFLLAPIIHLDFATVQTWAPAVLIALTAIGVLLWLQVLQWRPVRMSAVALTIFILASPQILQGVQRRQLGLLVGFLLAFSMWCVARNHLAAAGVALALSTIKPQMVILPLAWLMIWSIGDLARRWRLPAVFAGTLIGLVGAGELILPGWPRDFFLGLVAYRKYVGSPSLLQFALGDRPGWAVALVVVIGLLAWAWKQRKETSDSRKFAITLSGFLIGATLAMPLLAPFNQVLLILPISMVVRDWALLPKLARLAFAVSASWPWITELALLAFPPQTKSLSRLPLLPLSLVLLIPFLIPPLLMSRRIAIAAR
jgi:hypothetical protein